MSERGRIFQPLEKAPAVRSPRREPSRRELSNTGSPDTGTERPRNGEIGPGVPLFLRSPDLESTEVAAPLLDSEEVQKS